ncbi:MAG: hypothetical protein LBJ00_00700 [Planctomycetaceae bacterium]|nr:hypothetical protein [Planctomycetaceae bacterium]
MNNRFTLLRLRVQLRELLKQLGYIQAVLTTTASRYYACVFSFWNFKTA